MINKRLEIEIDGYGKFVINEASFRHMEEANNLDVKLQPAYFAWQCVHDADGKPVFSSLEDAKESAFNFVIAVAEKVLDLSGLTKKNSPPTNSSSTDSVANSAVIVPTN